LRAYECAHEPVKPCLRALLDRFATKRDARPACSVMHPPREMSFLVTCATFASGGDCDDVDRGGAQLALLRGFAEFRAAVPESVLSKSRHPRDGSRLYMPQWAASSRCELAATVICLGAMEGNHSLGMSRLSFACANM
jgi:hypothetical protein